MDDIPLLFDMPGETTITCTGERSVPVHTIGHEKSWFTIILAVMTDGGKLKLHVI